MSRTAAPPAPAPDDCPSEGWCWVRGRPMTVGGDRAIGTAYAIGAEGSFLRWDGDHWTSLPVPTRTTLVSAWVSSGVDLWATDADGGAWHHDGATWSEAPADSRIHRVIGTADGSVWAVASSLDDAEYAPRFLRRDGDRWMQPMEPFDYCYGGDFLVLDGGEIWSTGTMCDDTGLIVGFEVHRHDGTGWRQVGERLDDDTYGAALELVDGRVRANRFEWDGGRWNAVTPPVRPTDLPTDETVLFDGLGFTTAPESLACHHAYRLDDAHVWCFGGGPIHVRDGASWSPTQVDPFAETAEAERWGTIPPSLFSGSDTYLAWGSGPADVYRVRPSADYRLEHFDGASWTTVLDARVQDIDGAGPDDVWLVTADGPVHYDGSRFVAVPIPTELATEQASEVHALGGGTALAIARGTLLTYDGAWTVSYRAPMYWQLSAVGGTALDDVWIVEAAGGRSDEMAVVHFDGVRWSEPEPGSSWGAQLTTVGEQTWLATDGAITRLGSSDAPIAFEWWGSGATLWVGPDALWLTTARQAQRFAMP